MPSPAHENVKKIVKDLLSRQDSVTNAEVAALTLRSRQATHAQLMQLVKEGLVVPVGRGRGTRYRASAAAEPSSALTFSFALPGIQEDQLWKQFCAEVPFLKNAPPRAEALLHFATTEVLNNANDHSGGSSVRVSWALRERKVTALFEDDERAGHPRP